MDGMVDEPYFLTQTLPVWAAAFLSLLLLVFARSVVDTWGNGGRDPVSWLSKGSVFAALALLAFMPALLVETASVAINVGLLFYILFFSSFCYYSGKRAGWKAGRRDLSELLGMESPDHMEDTQDRLFESRLRFPARPDVVKSIAELAKRDQAPDAVNGNVKEKSPGQPPLELGGEKRDGTDRDLAEIEEYFSTKKNTRQ